MVRTVAPRPPPHPSCYETETCSSATFYTTVARRPPAWQAGVMCRSIQTLRPPFTEHAGEAEIRAAALQYVRKISGFRAPAAHNREAFDEAVDAVAAATAELLERLVVRGTPAGG
jgi:hypothetical protein